MRVMAELNMIEVDSFMEQTSHDTIEAGSSRWVRARASGITQLWVGPADLVTKGQTLGRLHDSFGHRVSEITSTTDGVVIGLNLDPTVNQGDAIIHIAEIGAK